MSVCPSSPDGFDLLLQFEYIKAVLCTYTDKVGGIFVVGLFVFGAVALYLYIRQDSVILPLGVVMIGGGSLMTVIVGPMVTIAVIILLSAPAAYVALMYNRHTPG